MQIYLLIYKFIYSLTMEIYMKKTIIIMLTGVFLLLILWPFSDKITYFFLNKNSEIIQNKNNDLLIYKHSKNYTFADGYKVKLNTPDNVDIIQVVAKSFKNTPEIFWNYFGVENLTEEQIVEKISRSEKISFFKVIEFNDNEVLLGESGKEFFYLSYSIQTENGIKYLYLRSSTNYWYISIIKPFHVYIMMSFLKFVK